LGGNRKAGKICGELQIGTPVCGHPVDGAPDNSTATANRAAPLTGRADTTGKLLDEKSPNEFENEFLKEIKQQHRA
jgi:hypothetical protein